MKNLKFKIVSSKIIKNHTKNENYIGKKLIKLKIKGIKFNFKQSEKHNFYSYFNEVSRIIIEVK